MPEIILKVLTRALAHKEEQMSYLRIWLHCIWGTKNRYPFLTGMNKNIILDHIKENARKKGIYLDFINGYREHVHCIISLKGDQTVSKTIQLLKGESSHWINKNEVIKENFEWADEFFAVSISESQVNAVRNYIRNQEEHHKMKSWEEEYSEFITKYGFQQIMR